MDEEVLKDQADTFSTSCTEEGQQKHDALPAGRYLQLLKASDH
jgi:hypothetical protein